MNAEERDQIRLLRSEVRIGFADLTLANKEMAIRIQSLELSRASSMGASEVRATAAVVAEGVAIHDDAERRWRIGIALSVGISIALGVANLLLVR